MKFHSMENHEEKEDNDMTKVLIHSHTAITNDSTIKLPTKDLHEEDPSSLWQYCIHREGEPNLFGMSLTVTLALFYVCCFYAVIAQLIDMPISGLAPTETLSNDYVIWVSKIFFLIFLLVQAESECIDGWRMAKFAQGTRTTILVVGFLQFFFGCLVEFISYSLIHRASTIFQIMTYSAFLTVFLRIDDVIVLWMIKMFPKTHKKVVYDREAFEKDSRVELIAILVLKIVIFAVLVISEMASQNWFV